MSTTDERLSQLDGLLETLGSVLVCYSGGVDSAFLLAAAKRVLGARAIGMTAVSPSLAPAELDDAVRVAREIGADHRVVESAEIHDPSYQKNAPDRCFYCKSELYRIAEQRRVEWGLAHVVNGTNVDDLGDYRPGLEAAKNAGVRSPFVELGMTKEDVREGARRAGLGIWDKPAAACLSSRIPFGTSVTPERLERIGRFEASLRGLGFRRVRVRYHAVGADQDKAFARIELDPSEIPRACSEGVREAIVEAGTRAGFLYAAVDLRGYRVGSHNEALDLAPRGRALPVVR